MHTIKKTSSPSHHPSTPQLLKLFCRCLRLADLRPPPGYQRLWTAPITLFYLIWQRLQSATLDQVVTDARRGGVDRLCPKHKPLSRGLGSKANTSYSDSRQRLPLDWVKKAFTKLAVTLIDSHCPSQPLPIVLLDGSTQRLRPYGDIAAAFPVHRTRRKRSYWCVARVLVSFCAHTGIATAARIDSPRRSEQALAVEMLLEAAKPCLYIGDRNFGVWRVVRAAAQGGAQVLVRLTTLRAGRLLRSKSLPTLLDRSLDWSPTRHDQLDPGLVSESVPGRLIRIRAHRCGFRPITLWLFTTLTDRQAYPPERLLELYGWRWRAELNFRTIKSTLQMDQSQAKSAEMVRKEFYAGLMGYNLVRSLMVAAAAQSGCEPTDLSFSKVHQLLAAILKELFMEWMSTPARYRRLSWLVTEASAAKLPSRRRPRPPEPRAQHYPPQVFPKIKTSRAELRRKLKNEPLKS
jgi:hypothetical protein